MEKSAGPHYSQPRHPPARPGTYSNANQWPEWSCVNCGRKFPPDTKHVICPGKIAIADKQKVDHCGGYLIRYMAYQRKIA